MPEDSEGFEIYFESRIFITAVITISLLSLVVGVLTSQNTELTFYESMTVIGVLASIALTGTLAYLYYRMSRIQDLQREASERQNDLTKLQQDILELEYEPKILIDEYELKPRGIHLTLRNLGRGLAENIGVRASVDVIGVADELTSHQPDVAADNILHTPDDVFYRDADTDAEYIAKIPLTVRDEGDSSLAKEFRGGMLSSDEGRVEYSSRVVFGIVEAGNAGSMDIYPDMFFDDLYEQGVRRIGVYLDLVYCNELGKSYVVPIMGQRGELKPGMDLSDVDDLRYGSTGSRSQVRESVKNANNYPPPE